MIYFCEECGVRMEMADRATGVQSMLQCPVCHDTMKTEKAKVEGLGWFGGPPGGISPSKEDAAAKKDEGRSLRVLVVDDSGLLRKVIRGILESDPHIRVVGEARDGAEALQMIPRIKPDVVTLDINMPVMDGITALKHIMIKFPRPTVMFSTLTKEGAWISFDALKYGAVDILNKPSQADTRGIVDQQKVIIEKVKMVSRVRIETLQRIRTGGFKEKINPESRGAASIVCAIGVGEGGYGALLKLIPRLDASLPVAWVVLHHAPEAQVDVFAKYLDENSALTVRRAKDKDLLWSGSCYLVPGKLAGILMRAGSVYQIRISAAPVSKKRETIDLLIRSLARAAIPSSIGVVLTGGGEDAAEGSAELIRSGGRVMIQNPDTCLFKTMPLNTIKKCHQACIVPIGMMADKINNFLTQKSTSF